MIGVRVFRDGIADEGAIQPSQVQECLADAGAFVWCDAPDPSDQDIAALGAAFDLPADDEGHHPSPATTTGGAVRGLRLRHASTALVGRDDVVGHEVHAVVGKPFLDTMRYGPTPFPIEAMKKRLQRQPDLLTTHPGGFAVYTLIDEVVDSYLSIVETLEDRADDPSMDGPEMQQSIFRVNATS
jgi:Mg2+ and Co2+ transporter CorA